MKRLLFLFSLLALTSCDNDKIRVENPLEATTLEIQQKVDTSQCYYVIIEEDDDDGEIIVLNQDRVVVAKLRNMSGPMKFATLVIVILFISIIIIVAFATNQ